MTPQEKQLLESLAARIANAPVTEKDREAEELIRQRIGSNPNALYVLTQTALIQDMALQHAKSQIQDLRQRLARQSEGGSPQEDQPHQSFLGKLFGTGGETRHAAPAPAPVPPAPAGDAPFPGPSTGSGFLRSAATTAAGVAAGALAFEGIEALMGHHGGMGMGQSFMGGGFGQPGFLNPSAGETVINNYYDSPGDRASVESSDASLTDEADTGNDTPSDDDVSATDADYDDSGDSSMDDSSDDGVAV
ncbi:MAG: DUF2076 domain-containing protein [Acidobacteriota bacterium]|nr:DUF2076 domain-containing protein [Acidobacteriota bacterium]